MMATRHAVLIRSTRASASSAAQRRPSAFIAASSSAETRFMRMREEWKVKRSSWISRCRAFSIAGISVSIVVLELGTIWPMRKARAVMERSVYLGAGFLYRLAPLRVLAAHEGGEIRRRARRRRRAELGEPLLQ